MNEFSEGLDPKEGELSNLLDKLEEIAESGTSDKEIIKALEGDN